MSTLLGTLSIRDMGGCTLETINGRLIVKPKRCIRNFDTWTIKSESINCDSCSLDIVGSVFKDTPSVYECVLVLTRPKGRNRFVNLKL